MINKKYKKLINKNYLKIIMKRHSFWTIYRKNIISFLVKIKVLL